MTSESRSCSVWIGGSSKSVKDLIAEHLHRLSDHPLLLWIEPAMGRSVSSDFSGLTTPREWTTPSTTVIAEARLYYPSGMLHLLADGPKETRWAAWHEGTDQDLAPVWCPSAGTRSETALLLKKSRTILLLPKSSERGLRGPTGDKQQVTAVEYYQDGILRWWRLEPDAKK